MAKTLSTPQNTIHQVTTMLATSKNFLFTGGNVYEIDIKLPFMVQILWGQK